MKLRFNLVVSTLFVLALSLPAFSQAVDTVIGQFSNSPAETFVGGISGDGRFVVFESRGNLDTQNPRNADGNNEIFLWDYAQRRIFQITDTKSVLIDPTGSSTTFSNIRVEIANTRPTISTDGRYVVFSSNATTNYPGDTTFPPVSNTTNPGNFDGNAFTVSPSPSPSPSGTPGSNPLTHDANLEIWFYQIPAYPAVADLSAGDEQPLTFLSPVDANGNAVAGAAFFQVTNTVPSQLPRSATTTTGAFIADDNHDASISDNGQAIAFVSSRDLVTGGNSFPNADNDEIFTYSWAGSPVTGAFKQVTTTPRGTVSSPIFSKFPTISGSGLRVAYASNGENQAFSSGSCVSTPPSTRNEEVFYADLDAAGAPTSCHQITNTTAASPGAPVNMFDAGRRMSRDGRYIAFDSYADLENGGANLTSFALYLYDTSLTTGNFRRIGPRSDADSGASGGDAHHYPGFTDTDGVGTPSTLILATRENIKPDGTIPATASDGLNNDNARPIQIYAYPLNEPANTATFKRLTKFPAPITFFASTRPITSNTRKRTAFNLALTEIGTGNQPDLLNEGYYLLVPTVSGDSTVVPTFATGASNRAVSATPTPTPTSTPTPTPTPSPSPTPQTPEPVLGLSPGMLAVLNFPAGSPQPITPRTAVGSNSRSFQLPIELSGVSLSINGAAAGLKSVGPQSITFVVPPFLSSTTTGTPYPLVLNMNGSVIKLDMTIVPTRPDLFTTTNGPGGRAIIYNVVNRVHTREPFTVNTIQIRGGRRVQTKLRLYLTGVANTTASVISIKIGSVTIPATLIQTGGIQEEPGVYTVDFLLPPELRGAGDQPIIVSVTAGDTTFTSRLEDTAPRLTILP